MPDLDEALRPYGLRANRGPDGYRVISGRVASSLDPLEGMVRQSHLMGRAFRRRDDEPLEAVLADDDDPEWVFDPECPPDQAFGLHRSEIVMFQVLDSRPAHHGYDRIVEIAVMPLPPQPEIGNGDHEAWRRYILALERRGHARALLDGVVEGVWSE